jgi:acyl-coenzyme A synthetase/AMP-(fatty) acid ligase
VVPARFNFTRDVVEAADPGKLALRFVDRDGAASDLTFGEIAGRAARWAGLLRRHVQPGDRLLVLVGKTPEWHAVMLAALKAGAVAIPCSEMLRGKDLDFRTRHSGATLLVADAACRGEVEAMEERPAVVYLGEADLDAPDTATADTVAGDPALILYTSGTTKDPKGVVKSHALVTESRGQTGTGTASIAISLQRGGGSPGDSPHSAGGKSGTCQPGSRLGGSSRRSA